MSTLREILNATETLVSALIESQGEETEAVLAIMGHAAGLPEKVDSYFHVVETMDAREAYLKARAEEFLIEAKVVANAKARVRENLKRNMQEQQLTELEGNDYRFSLSRSNPSVVISNEELVPKEYYKEEVVRSLEKKRVSEDLKAGVPVPGCHLQESVSLKSSVNKNQKRLKGA